MHRFSVWAPRVRKCAVLLDGQTYPMTAGERGWYHHQSALAQHGMDYGFLLDDDTKPYPDPRSARQPYGVHGLSQVVDHAKYPWMDRGWSAKPLSEAIIYELHVGTFTQQGTFAAAETRLEDLRKLGVTHVELMPLNSFPGRWGWGYDGVSLFAPQEHYGGPDGLKHFVNACHAAGLAVLIDVVYNHFGPDGNYTGRFAPYITTNHHTPWGGAVNFEEGGSTEVRRFFCDNALMWLRDYHADGLRLDAVQTFVDRSAVHILEQLSEEVAALATEVGRPLVLIAESDLNDPRVVTPRAARDATQAVAPGGYGGYGIDAQWSDDFHHAVFALLTGDRSSYYRDFGSIAQLAKSLQSAYVYNGIYSAYRDRNHGRPIGNLDALHFLGYIQNHDQVGNRFHGDRMHQSFGMATAKLAAALVMTAPFVPMIFQGEEFAASSPFLYFADHEDRELARAVSEGRRREHAHEGNADEVPDAESQEAFDVSKLHWEERQAGPGAEMLAWYRKLIELRSANDCLRDGDFQSLSVQYDEAQRWLTMRRGPMQMLFNFADKPVTLQVAPGSTVALATERELQIESSEIVLPALGFAALKLGESR